MMGQTATLSGVLWYTSQGQRYQVDVQAAVMPIPNTDYIRGVRVRPSGYINPAVFAQTLDCLTRAGANTLYLQSTGTKYAYYHSALIDNAGLDSLQLAIDAAHARGMKAYALIPVGRLPAPDFRLPGIDWLDFRREDVREFVADVAQELAEYNIDGLLCDYVRWDPAYLPDGFKVVPDDVTAAVVGVVERVGHLVPVEASVFPDWRHARQAAGQDWAWWIHDGIVLRVHAMTYKPDDLLEKYVELWSSTDFPSGAIVPRLTTAADMDTPDIAVKPAEDVLRQIEIVRKPGGRDITLWDDEWLCRNPELIRALGDGGW